MIDLPTETEMRRALEDRTCIICGIYETPSWREGVCNVCRFLMDATPEQRAEYERRLTLLASTPTSEPRQNRATDQAERLPDA